MGEDSKKQRQIEELNKQSKSSKNISNVSDENDKKSIDPLIANKELGFQTSEKRRRATALLDADAALVIERIQNHYQKEKVNGLEISASFMTETKVDDCHGYDDIYKIAEKQMHNKIHESSSIKKRTIDSIIKTLSEKNSRELTHSKSVSTLAEALAKKMAFSTDNIKLIRLTGLIHDIGKICISEKILNKDDKLDEDELDEIKKHPEIGYCIISSVNKFSALSDFILGHHERWDGKGYPRGLKGEEIPIQSRIIALCDSYDVMINRRTYKNALSKDEAIEEIKRCSGTQFDPTLAKVFTEQVLKTLKS